VGGVVVMIPGCTRCSTTRGSCCSDPPFGLLILSRRRWSDLAVPILTGLALALVAWVPFLLFEYRRDWSDFSTIANATDAQSHGVREAARAAPRDPVCARPSGVAGCTRACT